MNTVVTPQHQTSTARSRPNAGSLIKALRPRQWSKNLLVFGAPAAAGMLLSVDALGAALLAFVAFTLAASGTYLINDTIDAPADRLHPTKRHRPVAAGVIAPSTAVALGVVLLASSLVPASLTGEAELTATLVAYILLTLSYSLWLKKIAIVDVVVVAAGFGLRALGGAFAISVPVSQWFLIVTFFGALFIVAGKRLGEVRRLGPEAENHRATLTAYADFYAQHVMTLSSGITLVGYGLWAYDHGFLSDWWFLASLMLLVTVLLRFSLLVHAGASDDPVEIAWNDIPLRVMAMGFVALVASGIQLGGSVF